MSIKNDIKFILIELVIAILLLNIGYAKVSNASDNINMVTTNNIFDIRFSNAKFVKSAGVDTSNTVFKVSSDGQNIDLNVGTLEYPGAGAEFSIDITNNSSIPAKISSINVNGLADNSFLKVTILNLSQITSKTLNPDEKTTIYFTVVWDKDFSYSLNEKATFSLNINCEQAI